MEANRADYWAATTCRVLEVSRSGYYPGLKRGPSTRDQANTVLLKATEEVHEERDRT